MARPRNRRYVVMVLHDDVVAQPVHGPYRSYDAAKREAKRLNDLADQLNPGPNGPPEMIAQVVTIEGGPVRLGDYR